MTYWRITPEVPAELGPNTAMDRSVHPPRVKRLHLEFVGWLGSDLIECFPCYAVTSRLADALDESPLKGFELREMEMSTDEQFQELQPGRTLPPFRWLRITGRSQQDDFGIGTDNKLVISDAALALLREMRLEGCEVEPVDSTG